MNQSFQCDGKSSYCHLNAGTTSNTIYGCKGTRAMQLSSQHSSGRQYCLADSTVGIEVSHKEEIKTYKYSFFLQYPMRKNNSAKETKVFWARFKDLHDKWTVRPRLCLPFIPTQRTQKYHCLLLCLHKNSTCSHRTRTEI